MPKVSLLQFTALWKACQHQVLSGLSLTSVVMSLLDNKAIMTEYGSTLNQSIFLMVNRVSALTAKKLERQFLPVLDHGSRIPAGRD